MSESEVFLKVFQIISNLRSDDPIASLPNALSFYSEQVHNNNDQLVKKLKQNE